MTLPWTATVDLMAGFDVSLADFARAARCCIGGRGAGGTAIF